MKFLIIGDLHGKKPKIHFKDFDAILAPGDFCSDKARKFMFKALSESIKNSKSKMEWYDLLGKARSKYEIEKSLADGRKILEKLNSLGKPVYLVPGNWDWTAYKKSKWAYLKNDHYKGLIKGLDNIVDLHNKIKTFGDYDLIGYGISSGPEYPQHDLKQFSSKKLKSIKKSYESKLKKISSLFSKAKKPVIFLSHNVPFNTKLDKITDKSSPRYGYHFGSVLARDAIKKHKPLVCIGGHMHEHFGRDKLGSTVIINAGFGPKVNTMLEIQGNKIKKLLFKRIK